MNFIVPKPNPFRTPHSILFVTSQLRQREIKMAHALRSVGWVVGLLYYKTTPFVPEGNFDYFWEVQSAKSAHTLARKLKPRIIHVFSGAIDDYILLFCREKISPVVIDLNDIFSPSLMDYCPERYPITKEALALADGFCGRDLQVKYAERFDKLQIPKQNILFPEYCWNNASIPIRKKISDEIHLVSVGTISLETYGMYDCCYLQLVRSIVKQKIHFHMYPPWCYRKDNYYQQNVNFDKDYADFIKLARQNPYLHIHDSLPVDQLLQELPQYDFGIISGGFAGFGQRYTHFKPNYVAACYSGRITDYLDAYLPVLINEEVRFDYWLLKRYEICIDLKGILQPNFKSKLQFLVKSEKMQQKVIAARALLSIKANASRLAKFYTETMENTVWPQKQDSFFKRFGRKLQDFKAKIL